MSYVRRFILMMQFMTSIPINISVRAERDDYGKGLALAPVVGLIIGLFVAGGNFLIGKLFPVSVTSVLTMAIYIGLTGGLHFDGLGDTADGLFSNRPKEKILEIMKDSRVGTNALLAVVIALFLYITLISSLDYSGNNFFGVFFGDGSSLIVLMLMPVTGRIGSLISSGVSSYAGTSDGPGRWCVEYCGYKDVLFGTLIYFGIFVITSALTSTYFLLLPAVIAPISAFTLSKLLGKKLGGVTGDILGAICELNQIIFLIIVFVAARFL